MAKPAAHLQQASDHQAVPRIVHEVLRSPGQPLNLADRAFMERHFGHDFGKVRVHTGTEAVRSAIAVGARAYTVGLEIVFGANQYAPGSIEGRRLLAHELAHTIQQGARGAVALGGLRLGQDNDVHEREADAFSDLTFPAANIEAASRAATPTAAPVLQRQPEKKGDTPSIQIHDNMPAVFFQFDSIEFRHDTEAGDSMIHFLDALTQIQEHVKKYKAKAHITLHGFASPDGKEAHNLTLSQNRADRIKDLLVAAGIPEGQITSIGHGAGNQFPVPTLNRCVEFERTPEVIVK